MIGLSPLLVVDIDKTGVFPAQALAQALGLEQASVAPGLDAALSLLSDRKTAPRYVVIDIGLHAEDLLPLLENLMRLTEHASRVVVVGNVNDLHFYRTLKSMGVFEYFTHPASVSDIRVALEQHAPGRQAATGPGASGTVLAFMSAASGDGASTVALNVAHALALDTRKPVVLVDMDYQFGMVARHLDLHAPFGIRELFENPERGVDATLVSKMLLPYGEHLRVVAAPDSLRTLPAIRPDTVRELIAVLKSQFAYVVLDIPHVWTPWVAEALAQADRTLVVGQLWLRSLTHITRLLAAWAELGISRDDVLVAINRSGARYREAISPQDFERVCMKTITYYLPNDIRAVVGAENEGKTLVESGVSSLERQLRDMAHSLTGNRSTSAIAASADGTGRLGGMLKKFSGK